MANNVTLSAGTADGAVVATDDIAGVHYQYNKVGLGADDTFTILTGNTGGVSAGTLRVTLATDVALPAGTNGIGKLTANSGVTIGAVEIAAAQTLATVTTVTTVSTVTTLTTLTGGGVSHDGAAGSVKPHLIGGFASAAAPTDVSADGDAVQGWMLRNGAQVVNLSAAGALIGATSNALDINLKSIAGSLTLSTVTTVGTVSTVTAVTTVSTVTSLTQFNGNAIALNTGTRSAGTLRVTIATDDIVPASQSGTWTVQPGNTANTTAWLTQNTPATSGGLTTFMASGSDGSSILVATAQVVKASAGQLYGYYAYNPEAAVSFVHFYNTAAASVTVGTTNPLFTLAIPAGSAANLFTDTGITFSNAGWSVAATTTAGGNTAPATGVSLVAWYK